MIRCMIVMDPTPEGLVEKVNEMIAGREAQLGDTEHANEMYCVGVSLSTNSGDMLFVKSSSKARLFERINAHIGEDALANMIGVSQANNTWFGAVARYPIPVVVADDQSVPVTMDQAIEILNGGQTDEVKETVMVEEVVTDPVDKDEDKVITPEVKKIDEPKIKGR